MLLRISCFEMQAYCMTTMLIIFCHLLVDGGSNKVHAFSFSAKTISSAAWQTSSSISHVMEHLFITSNSPPYSSLLKSSSDLEDLTNIRIPSLQESGIEIHAHLATPSNWDEALQQRRQAKNNNEDLKVVIMIHEFFGLTDSIVDRANGLAEDLGCLVIAPDTFRGTTTTFIPKAIWLALSTPQDRVNDDLDSICSYVESGKLLEGIESDENPNSNGARCKFAVLGFCYGGGKAIRYTSQRRRDAATVVFYGMPVTDTNELRNLDAPVCGIYGRDDVQFPMPLLDEFQSALEGAQVENDVKIYDGVGHAFWKSMEQVRRGDQPQQQAFQQCTRFLRNFFDSDK